ncbi:hypothetical protein D3C87_395370 [compost metagenome]
MDQATFNLYGGYNNGTDDSKKGGISHGTALALGQTIDDIIGDKTTQAKSDMLNKVVNDIVSKLPDVDRNKLHNGVVGSVIFNQNDITNDYEGNKTNTTEPIYFENPVANTKSVNGKAAVTFYLDAFSGSQFTVHNIQNTMVHEYVGHFIKKIIGADASGSQFNYQHAKAVELQMAHPTWNGTTQSFKNGMEENWAKYLKKK